MTGFYMRTKLAFNELTERDKTNKNWKIYVDKDLHLVTKGGLGFVKWLKNSSVRKVTRLCVIFLTPLWNEGKQPRTFNCEVSPQLQVDSKNHTFLRKKTFARQKPTLCMKLGIKIKFWHTCRLFRLNPGGRGELLTSELSWVAA